MALSISDRHGPPSPKQAWALRQKWCPKCEKAGLSRSGFWSAADGPDPLTWWCYRHGKTKTVQVP